MQREMQQCAEAPVYRRRDATEGQQKKRGVVVVVVVVVDADGCGGKA
jgi:hypothetical protein